MIVQTKFFEEVYLIDCNPFNDSRGSFTKSFKEAFLELGLDFPLLKSFCRSPKLMLFVGCTINPD